MKNLFNNPWFIAALGIFAVGYLGVSTVMPLLTEDTAVATTTDDFDMDDYATTNIDVVSSRQSQASREGIGWLTEIGRDPFSGTLLADTSRTPDVLPTVDALFIGAGVQAAVVNSRLVHVGDTIDQFRVTHIADKHVQVSRGGLSYRLEPDV